MKIADGNEVVLDYTMRLEDGEVVDTTEGAEPVAYVQGAGEILVGLERAVAGMSAGEQKMIVLAAADAFGEIDPEAQVAIPKSDLPPEACQVGAEVRANGPEGQVIDGRVAALHEDRAVVDFNHPLAGRTLHCSVRIADVRQIQP